jgi:hypothetical protein
LFGKPVVRRQFGLSPHRKDENIETGLKEITRFLKTGTSGGL